MQNKQVEIFDFTIILPESIFPGSQQIMNKFELCYQHSFAKDQIKSNNPAFQSIYFIYDPQSLQISLEIYATISDSIKIKILDIVLQQFSSLGQSPLVPVFTGVQTQFQLSIDEFKALLITTYYHEAISNSSNLEQLILNSDFKLAENKFEQNIQDLYKQFLITEIKAYFHIQITPSFTLNASPPISNLSVALRVYNTAELEQNGIICLFHNKSQYIVQIQLVDDPSNRQFSLATQIKIFSDPLQVLNILPLNQSPLRSSVQNQIAGLQQKLSSIENKRFLYVDVFKDLQIIGSGSIPIAQVIFKLINSFKQKLPVDITILLDNNTSIELECLACGQIKEYYDRMCKVEDKVFQDELKKEKLKQKAIIVEKPVTKKQQAPQPVKPQLSAKRNPVTKPVSKSPQKRIITPETKKPQIPIQTKRPIQIDLNQPLTYTATVTDCQTQADFCSQQNPQSQTYKTKIYKYLDVMTIPEAKKPTVSLQKEFQSRDIDATHGASLGKVVSSAYERVMNRYK